LQASSAAAASSNRQTAFSAYRQTQTPPVSPARSPPEEQAFDGNQTPADAPENGEPAPEFQFDQTVSW
jgi:hypothetical protein